MLMAFFRHNERENMQDISKEKIDFIVKTDGLLRDYIETVVLKSIKDTMQDDPFSKMSSNHIRAALMIANIAPCSLKEFATAMRLSKASASALVNRMVKAGTVQREINQDNRREVILCVSPAFEDHINYVHAELMEWFETVTKQLGPETFAKWYEAMISLNAVLQKKIKSDISF